jgi:hypothetical protein
MKSTVIAIALTVLAATPALANPTQAARAERWAAQHNVHVLETITVHEVDRMGFYTCVNAYHQSPLTQNDILGLVRQLQEDWHVWESGHLGPRVAVTVWFALIHGYCESVLQ